MIPQNKPGHVLKRLASIIFRTREPPPPPSTHNNVALDEDTLFMFSKLYRYDICGSKPVIVPLLLNVAGGGGCLTIANHLKYSPKTTSTELMHVTQVFKFILISKVNSQWITFKSFWVFDYIKSFQGIAFQSTWECVFTK